MGRRERRGRYRVGAKMKTLGGGGEEREGREEG